MKVLMLGWEYPPNVSGGLGIATHGLAEALSQYVDLQLILPHQPPLTEIGDSAFMPKEESDITHISTSPTFSNTNSPQAFEAYASYQAPIQIASLEISEKVKKKAQEIRRNSGNSNSQSLYGKALMEKVSLYAKEATKIAKNTDFDLIHAHDWMTFPAAMKIQKASGKPLVVHIHSLETDRTTNEQVRNPIFKIEEEAIEKADLVIPVSDYTKQRIEQHYATSTKKITSIHNGLAANIQQAVTTSASPAGTKVKLEAIGYQTTTKKKAKKKKKNILFVGRLTAQKGIQTFIRTATKLLESRKDLIFTIAGLGDQLEEMMQLVEEADIEHAIHFKGFVQQDQLALLLQEADMLFMPSVSEPFGLAALEAAQFGLPIVISNQSGVIEVLPGVLTAEYWDSKTFARHIKVLLDYKSIRKAFGKANQKAVKKRSWAKVAQKVTAAYKKLQSNAQ